MSVKMAMYTLGAQKCMHICVDASPIPIPFPFSPDLVPHLKDVTVYFYVQQCEILNLAALNCLECERCGVL